MSDDAFLKIAKLDSQVSSFCRSISQSIPHTGRSPPGSFVRRSTSSSSFLDRGVSENNHSNPGLNTSKTHVIDASKFLQGLHQRLSSAESSLVPLVDLLLDVDDEGGGAAVGDELGAELDNSFQRSCNGNGNVHKMQLSDLSRELRSLHALHAKQILHIESLLVSQHGYITSSQQEEDDDGVDDDSMGQPTLAMSRTMGSDVHSSSPLDLIRQVHDRENSFQPTPMHGGPLPRLSEVTLETDGGTPSSLIMVGRHGLEKRSLTPLPRENSAANTNGTGPLKSLKEEMNMEIIMDRRNEHDNISTGDCPDNSVTTSETDSSDIAQTPSFDKMQLSSTTINILQKSNQDTSDADSDEKSPCSTIVEHSLNSDETKQRRDPNIDESRDSSMFESCGDDESVYDSCEETLEHSEYLSTDTSYDEGDDEERLDATTSTTSTVVQKLKVKGVAVENNLENFVGNRSCNADEEERVKSDVDLTDLAVEDDVAPPDVTSALDTVLDMARIDINETRTSEQIDFRGIDNRENDSTIDMQSHLDATAPHNTSTIDINEKENINETMETIPDTLVMKVGLSPPNRDNNDRSVSEYPTGDSSEELDIRKGDNDLSSNTQLNDEVVTSPLDRFQVQVFNGGKECKVTPIGDDIIRSAQSPILKSWSPLLCNSVSSRGSHETKRIHMAGDGGLSHKGASIDIAETESFYSSSSTANCLSSVNGQQNNGRHSRDSCHAPVSFDFDVLKTDNKNDGGFHSDASQKISLRGSALKHSEDVYVVGKHKKNDVLAAQRNVVPFIRSDEPSACSTEESPITTIRTPRTAAFIEKHMSDEKDRLLGVLNKGLPISPKEIFQTEIKKSESKTNQDADPDSRGRMYKDDISLKADLSLVDHVAADEYEDAPPIIKKLVSREHLNQGIMIINNWLVSHDNDIPSYLPDSIALDILGKTFDISQVKRICLSLCSLQRMMICRKNLSSGESAMHYVFLRKRNSNSLE